MAGYPLTGGAGVVVAVMLSHLPTTLAAGRHITVPADRASTAVSPTKHANCQLVDLIQLLAGFGDAFANTAFAQKKKGDGISGWGKGRIIMDHSEAGDTNHQQRNIPVFVEEV